MYFYYISYCVYVCILINIISWNQIIINNTIEEITYDGDIIEEERKKEKLKNVTVEKENK